MNTFVPMYSLPPDFAFIQDNQTWAIAGIANSGHSEMLNRIRGGGVEHVSFRHHFRNLSNTTDFYYQQRFNSSDSEDSLTVIEYLHAQANHEEAHHWNLHNTIQTFALEPLVDEQVIKLSNGETKRLLIAAALIRNPAILLLDHPLTGLDVSTRQHFDELLHAITDSGIVVIIACDPTEIPKAVTHVAVMKDHTIIDTMPVASFNANNYDLLREVPINDDLLKGLVAMQQPVRFEQMISMNNVTVEYDCKKILDNINWHVRQGDRWALSGANGAGKSTLLSLVNGDNPQAYANDIILFDRKRGSGESIWDIKKQIGFVSPELFQYFPTDSSCLHVIESGFHDTVGLFRPSDPQLEKRCLSWLKLLHLEADANKLFNMVSTGTQRLCLLARALVKTPALLILDEPTQGLDSPQQRFFSRLIDEICSLSRVTLIYVSHYEHHLPKAINHYLKLDKGRVVG